MYETHFELTAIGRRLLLASVLALIPLSIQSAWAQTETVLYNFCSQGVNCLDGGGPAAGLIMDKEGDLYGTTAFGGAYGIDCDPFPQGCGTVFQLNPSGTETVLHSFANNGTDGFYPFAGLIMDANGKLYGTTFGGGANACEDVHCGTVFELTAGGTETVLHSFAPKGTIIDGISPEAGLILDANGNLYGTTNEGGAHGYGTAFELSPPTRKGGGWTETILHSFASNGADGLHPRAGLIMDAKGNLYGTTPGGGSYGSGGTVFEISPPAKKGDAWTETVLHSFTCPQGSGCADGILPVAGLIMDANGDLYGTTNQGGAYGYGTVFELSPSGTETILHNFLDNWTDGGLPDAGLIMDAKGNLYGTTSYGGTYDGGTVFRVVP